MSLAEFPFEGQPACRFGTGGGRFDKDRLARPPQAGDGPVRVERMRLLIASDIHANAAALERVSQDADAVVVLGDLVDYGPDPPASTPKAIRTRATGARPLTRAVGPD